MYYIKDNLKVKQSPNLNEDEVSSNWMEVKDNRNKWFVAQYYREHQKIGDADSASQENQGNRLDKFLTKLEAASTMGDVVLIGDFNIILDLTNETGLQPNG